MLLTQISRTFQETKVIRYHLASSETISDILEFVKRRQSGLQQSGYKLATDWLQTGYQLATDWRQTGYRLATDWLQTGYRLATKWLQTGDRLATNWLQIRNEQLELHNV